MNDTKNILILGRSNGGKSIKISHSIFIKNGNIIVDHKEEYSDICHIENDIKKEKEYGYEG